MAQLPKFEVGQRVKPADIDKVKNDTLLHESGRQIIVSAAFVGSISQIKVEDDGRALNYVTYGDPDKNGIVTQVYRDEELEVIA